MPEFFDGLSHGRLVGARHLQIRYGVSDMSIWRWLNDQNLNFPRPIYIRRRRFWKLAELEAWERARAASFSLRKTRGGFGCDRAG
jgi:predicted DNA-binding transcriptional regulator AlpA